MMNFGEGTEVPCAEGRAIRSNGRGHAHLIFGPYCDLDSGNYVATFRLSKGADASLPHDRLCAIVDVAVDDGARSVATRFVFTDELGETMTEVELPFALTSPGLRVEARVRACGAAPIVALDEPQIRHGASQSDAIIPLCELTMRDPGEVIDLFARGYDVRRGDQCLRFTAHGLTIVASERDDLNFAGEVLEHRAYNVVSADDACVIDIGMNVGLTSLFFAKQPNVRAVHAFEPFASTFAKAQRNLAANPGIADKIVVSNVGLSDHDGDEVIFVPVTSDSGSRATISVEGGQPVSLRLRDAGRQLAPIIVEARSLKRLVIVKMDCEGSEFAIFESLSRANLLVQIDVLLVEWHAMFDGKTATDLIAPLLAAGFTVIDLSPAEGNGFFYAIRNSSRTSRRARSPWARIAASIRR